MSFKLAVWAGGMTVVWFIQSIIHGWVSVLLFVVDGLLVWAAQAALRWAQGKDRGGSS